MPGPRLGRQFGGVLLPAASPRSIRARSNLLFERFISRERNEPPDIDVDFEHQRREEVIQYIYDKYGRDRAAIAAVVISYRPRSAVRDVGKALGIDLAARSTGRRRSHALVGQRRSDQRRAAARSGLRPRQPGHRSSWIELARPAASAFRATCPSTSAASSLRASSSTRLVPVENAAMKDRTVIQWDKDDLETMGLLKVDVLALGMLSRDPPRAGFHVRSRRGAHRCAMHDIPDDDQATYDMICEADTVGVFQIEARAQMSMLPRLKPRELSTTW